jgi:HD-like signal output (HDOD) protein
LSIERVRQLVEADNYEFIRGLFVGQMMRGELELPMLPEIAARVVAVAGSPDADASGLARIITGDQALAAHVMRVAKSAIYQPRHPIESLQHAISWLGMAEVSDIAFTVAVQGKLLNVPGQRARAQQLWKQAVGTAQWARLVADTADCQGEPSYLAGLLHEIGKPAALQALAELSRRAKTPLADDEVDRLVAEFHVTVGTQLATSWKLPDAVVSVVGGWRNWAEATERKDACATVYLAHHLAEHMLANSGSLAADALAGDPVVAHFGWGLPEVLGLCGHTEHIRAVIDGY